MQEVVKGNLRLIMPESNEKYVAREKGYDA